MNSNLRSSISMIALLVPAALLAYIWSVMPPSADDLWYTERVTLRINNGFSTLYSIVREIRWRFWHDNIRLANIVYLFGGTLLPRWVTGVFLGGCVWGGLRLMMLLGCVKMRQPFFVALILLIYSNSLQWLVHVFSHDFALNYVPALTLTGGVIYLFIRDEKLGRGRRILLFVLALLAGLWHEASAGILVAGLLAYMVATRRYSRTRIVTTILAGVGVLVFFCTPGMWWRSSVASYAFSGQPFQINAMVAISLTLIPIAIHMWILDFRVSRRASPSTALVVLCACALLVAQIPMLIIPGIDRATFCPMILCSAAWCVVLRHFFKWLTGKAGNIVMGVIPVLQWGSVLIILLIVGHFGRWAYEAREISRSYPGLLNQYRKANSTAIFCDIDETDISYPCGIEIWDAKITPNYEFYHPGYTQMLTSRYVKRHDRHLIFIPTPLADVDVNPGTSVSDNPDIKSKDGYLYTAFTDSLPVHIPIRRMVDGVNTELIPDTFRTTRGAKFLFLDQVKQ